MKKIKQMRIKAILLTIVAVLTLGFTSCTDELASDQTQGKPGYLTINVKTLKPKQTKTTGAAPLDYQVINNINVFVFNAAGNKLIHKYFTNGTGTGQEDFSTNGTGTFSIPVTTLAGTDYAVAVANSGDLNAITSLAALEALEVDVIRATNLGLHMTGRASIIGTTSYTTDIRIAPIESKITVNVTPSAYIAANYNVTGIYVVNAISKTKLPIIRTSTHSGTWSATDVTPASLINNLGASPFSRTASNGYTAATAIAGKDFNFYTTMGENDALLKDEDVNTPFLTGSFHYYVGENYSNNDIPANAGGALIANAGTPIANGANNANTLVLVRVSPVTTANGGLFEGTGDKYYTYEFNAASATNNVIIAPFTTGLSVRRKTNYNLTFNLNSVGSPTAFERSRTLSVTVTADPWEQATATF